MERWAGKVAIVTGASQGMGAAIAADLVKHSMKVYGCARNLKGLEALQTKLKGQAGEFFPIQCDLRDEKSILHMFEVIDKRHGAVHVLVNNAGVVKNATLLDAPTEDWREMLDVMVLAPTITAREAIKSMKKYNVDDGHVINILSIGPYAFPPMAFLHFPCATKCALNALTKGLRHELLQQKSGIRISAISPGMTETGTFEHITIENTSEKAHVLDDIKSLKVTDIAAAVTFVLSAPPHCDIFDVLMHPTGGF
jgi:NADP-dependent 3-hydroxy acid dehydrogenase YdfG